MAADDQFAQLRDAIEEELYPYGQYLAMRGAKEGEQRFGVPEVALATLTVLVWATQQFLHSYFREKEKQGAPSPDDPREGLKHLEAQIRSLQAELQEARQWQDDMETRWLALAQELPADLSTHLAPTQIHHEELLAILVDLGLSQRTARKAASAIGQHLERHSADGAVDPQREYLIRLHKILADRFDMEELRTLCLYLGLAYDDLRGEGKSAKARELVTLLQRRGRLAELAVYGSQLRPDVAWNPDNATISPNAETVSLTTPGAPRSDTCEE